LTQHHTKKQNTSICSASPATTIASPIFARSSFAVNPPPVDWMFKQNKSPMTKIRVHHIGDMIENRAPETDRTTRE
jgi:hypothetical protein